MSGMRSPCRGPVDFEESQDPGGHKGGGSRARCEQTDEYQCRRQACGAFGPVGDLWDERPAAAAPSKEEYSRAVGKWHGGHFVLVVLRQELDKGDGGNREVVYQAVRFLANWNKEAPRCRHDMSMFKGAGSIADAMQAYPYDREIQYATICCLLNYTCESEAAKLQDLVDEDAVVLLVRALKTFSDDTRIVTHGVKILDRLHGASHRYRLVKDGAMVAVSEVILAHEGSWDVTACYNLVKKLCGP